MHSATPYVRAGPGKTGPASRTPRHAWRAPRLTGKATRQRSEQSERLRRRQQMMAQARLRKASWMSSRISQRIRSRRNQCSSAMDCPATQRQVPSPEPCAVLRRRGHGRDALLPHLLRYLPGHSRGPRRPSRAPPRPAAAAPDRRDRLDQGHKLGDVVAVAAGQRDRQRDAVRFGDYMVLGAGPGTAGRARPGFGPPFIARTCEPPVTARDQSSAPAAFSSASSDSCSRCHTPASCQSRGRRQQVIPSRTPAPAARTPTEPRGQHEQDPGQDLPVIQPLAAGMVSPPRDDRQHRLNPLP